MPRPSARRELAFVVGVALSGLVAVLVVAFAPWYSPGSGAGVPAPARAPVEVVVVVDTVLLPTR